MDREKLEIGLPTELIGRMDAIIELLGFGGREELVEAAVRRFLNRYRNIDIKVLL